MPKHHETRTLPYTADQMYALVADVESYPGFIPWIGAARITSRKDEGETEVLEADLVISFKVFRERFRSRVVLDPAQKRIETSYLDGPFHHMESVWRFEDRKKGCEVLFDVDFEFKSRLLGGAASMFFNDAMQRIVRAFEREAAKRYG